jgi:hypothetical protein
LVVLDAEAGVTQNNIVFGADAMIAPISAFPIAPTPPSV